MERQDKLVSVSCVLCILVSGDIHIKGGEENGFTSKGPLP